MRKETTKHKTTVTMANLTPDDRDAKRRTTNEFMSTYMTIVKHYIFFSQFDRHTAMHEETICRYVWPLP